jgi:NAD(P)H-nitrite reductase large subunit
MRVVIIGNSATAVGAIESMRQHDQEAEILVLSEEPHAIYSRPLLSHYLAGEIDKGRLAYRRSDFYSRYHVQPLLNSRVVAVDPAAHQVLTEGGKAHAYDKLLMCMGGMPIIPPIPGVDSAGAFSFTRFDDAQGILRYLASRPIRHAAVIGGGMIGLKATDALMKRGLGVTVVELAPRILSAALDETASAMMADLLGKAGVEVITGNTVVAVHSQRGGIEGVELRDGRVILCELLLFGIGVRPNATLAREAGIVVNRGIVVDEYMRTSVPDVYAAGDVAEAYDLVVDMNRTVAIWPNAYRQGAIAGAHMVGIPRADRGGIPMNTVEVCGVTAMSIGDGSASGDGLEVLAEADERKNRYKRLVLQGDRLVGVILVGQVNRAGIYTGLIRNKLSIASGLHGARNGDWRKALMSEHFGLLSLPDEYRKHIVTGAGIEV